MVCKEKRCIYWAEGLCTLPEISINDNGTCTKRVILNDQKKANQSFYEETSGGGVNIP